MPRWSNSNNTCGMLAFCVMLGGCLFGDAEILKRDSCLFRMAIAHRNSYVIFTTYTKYGTVLIQPLSYDLKNRNFNGYNKNWKDTLSHFHVKPIFKPIATMNKVFHNYHPPRGSYRYRYESNKIY